MSHEHDARELREWLYDVEVAERTHFEKRHAVFFCVRPCLFCGDLSLERKVQPVTHKYTRHARCMLRKDKETRKWVTKGEWEDTRDEDKGDTQSCQAEWISNSVTAGLSHLFIQWGLSYLCPSLVHREKSTRIPLAAVLSSHKWIQIKPESSLKSYSLNLS